jgi:hypothetical protein
MMRDVDRLESLGGRVLEAVAPLGLESGSLGAEG